MQEKPTDSELADRRKKRRRSVNWGGLLPSLALLLLIVFAVAPDSGKASGLGNVQPALRALAREQPQAMARVIVQKVGDAAVEALVPQLGGAVTKDLHIINAFAAELPAGAVPQLARADGVRWLTLDAPVSQAALPPAQDGNAPCGHDLGAGANCFPGTLDLQSVRDMGLDGSGIGVAVIDSGITQDRDFAKIDKFLSFSPLSTNTKDVYGHGTHVAGIIAGNGRDSGGLYSGMAPGATLLSLKISDETGMAYESDTVDAMQWVLENKGRHNIRVVNLSVNATLEQSYHSSPLDASVEILWFNGIVVVASAGNSTVDGFNTIHAAPANDPFLITVGASDEHDNYEWSDDTHAPYSAFGATLDGFAKPEIIAPGQDVVSVLSRHSQWHLLHPDRVVMNGEYFRLSGTSMAAPIVTGAVALVLQNEPDLNPDQVKYRLLNATNRSIDAIPYLDVYQAVTSNTTETANTGTVASQLLWTGDEPVTWDSTTWNSVNWASVNWASVNWASVNWASVNWASVYWDD